MVPTSVCKVPPPPAPPQTACPFAAVRSGGNGKGQRLLVRDAGRCTETQGDAWVLRTHPDAVVAPAAQASQCDGVGNAEDDLLGADGQEKGWRRAGKKGMMWGCSCNAGRLGVLRDA